MPMKLQWRRFKWMFLITIILGIIGLFLLYSGIQAGGNIGIFLIILGSIIIAGVCFDMYRMYGY